MPELVAYILLFTGVGAAFILVNLLVGTLIRPVRPNPEKAAIYECGEPTVGSAWIQFDLRYYVIALLFVIFDVEVAFFFPWAVVFGKLNTLAEGTLPVEQRVEVTQALVPPPPDPATARTEAERKLYDRLENDRKKADKALAAGEPIAVKTNRDGAASMAWIAFIDIFVFFAVLLVGFAYLWRRGDLNWVRSTAAERAVQEQAPRPPPVAARPPLVEV